VPPSSEGIDFVRIEIAQGREERTKSECNAVMALIEIYISIRKNADLSMVSNDKTTSIIMKDEYSTMRANLEKSPDYETLTKMWDSIDWDKVVSVVNRMQVRIVKATQEKDWNRVKRLCYLLVHSHSAKLLAVRRVTSNKGKNTSGIDGQIWGTSAQKMKGALSLTDKHYKAQPLKRVYIEKKGKKEKRPLGIPTMYDRSMQALYALALYPIAETTADRCSFGFRMGRSTFDAKEYIHILLSRKCSSEWILEGDIKSCFDRINHEWLLEHIPMDRKILQQFLMAGYIYEEQLFPTEAGTPQGGIISPILANMTLDGIEGVIKTIKPKWKRLGLKIRYVRYADDFIVTAPKKEILEYVKTKLETFFAERGLELSKEKTLITHINDGFDFLGWNVRKYDGKLIIKPSKKSIKNLLDAIHKMVTEGGKAISQDNLILGLNPILRGWANYHKTVCAKSTFSKVDHLLTLILLHWAKRRHPNKGIWWIKNKYRPPISKRKWIFRSEKHELFQLSDVKIVRRPSLKLDMNPFLDWEYFYLRKVNKPIIAAQKWVKDA